MSATRVLALLAASATAAMACVDAAPARAASGYVATARPIGPRVAFADGQLFYETHTRSTWSVRRLDVASGGDALAYRPPRRWEPYELYAGGGRAAVQLGRFGRASERMRVVALPAAGGSPATIASARLIESSRDGYFSECGGGLELRAVSDAGEIVTEEARAECPGDRGPYTSALRAYRPDGTVRELHAREVDVVSDVDARDLLTRLSGDRLLEASDLSIHVTDLATRARRRIARSSPRHGIWRAELDPAGNVVVSEARLVSRRLFGWRVRLVRPGDPARGGAVLAESRRAAGVEGLVCGGRIVVASLGRGGGLRVTVRDTPDAPPRLVHSGPVRGSGGLTVACDASALALVWRREGRRGRVETLPLAG